MGRKRCVCGRSSTLPLCDGSHRSEGWSCATEVSPAPYAVLSTQTLRSLAERLAHRLRGVAVESVSGPVSAKKAVVLFDGTDASALRESLLRVSAQERMVVCVGVPAEVASWALDIDDVRVTGEGDVGLFLGVESAVMGAAGPPAERGAVPQVFLSHAVADEGALVEAVQALRQDFGLDVFLCGDSIDAGTRWQPEIERHIRSCDRFVLICSEASRNSVYCAFEVGLAVALDKSIRLVSIDGQAPFLPVAQMQCVDVPRLMTRKPWLTRSEAILEALLGAGGSRVD